MPQQTSERGATRLALTINLAFSPRNIVSEVFDRLSTLCKLSRLQGRTSPTLLSTLKKKRRKENVTACPGTSLSRRVPWRRAERRTEEKEQRKKKKWIENEVPGIKKIEKKRELLI
ncbi:hypothetical protein E2C01_078159 [Portunus trituberculatus]|uniref:Uncharacterized protein n=1 Tax=Portunus trituberculatus TaxID=210409 RepID=A0A5B7IRZ3_PORTR|nr:hypothetical protein [Portunus trituberculatus]